MKINAKDLRKKKYKPRRLRILEPLDNLINEVKKHDEDGSLCLIQVRNEIYERLQKYDLRILIKRGNKK